jgi:hypothetical protein
MTTARDYWADPVFCDCDCDCGISGPRTIVSASDASTLHSSWISNASLDLPRLAFPTTDIQSDVHVGEPARTQAVSKPNGLQADKDRLSHRRSTPIHPSTTSFPLLASARPIPRRVSYWSLTADEAQPAPAPGLLLTRPSHKILAHT